MGPCRVEGEKGPCGNLPTAAHPSLSKQKQKGVPATEHPSCTTIYAAATGLPLDTAPAPGRAPRPPPSQLAEPSAPQGYPSLSQVRVAAPHQVLTLAGNHHGTTLSLPSSAQAPR